MGGGSCGVSANEYHSCAHHVYGAQINFRDLTPYFTYLFNPPEDFFMHLMLMAGYCVLRVARCHAALLHVDPRLPGLRRTKGHLQALRQWREARERLLGSRQSSGLCRPISSAALWIRIRSDPNLIGPGGSKSGIIVTDPDPYPGQDLTFLSGLWRRRSSVADPDRDLIGPGGSKSGIIVPDPDPDPGQDLTFLTRNVTNFSSQMVQYFRNSKNASKVLQ